MLQLNLWQSRAVLIRGHTKKKVNLFSTDTAIGMSVENETHMRKWLLPANSFSCKWKVLPLLGLEACDKKKNLPKVKKHHS